MAVAVGDGCGGEIRLPHCREGEAWCGGLPLCFEMSSRVAGVGRQRPTGQLVSLTV